MRFPQVLCNPPDGVLQRGVQRALVLPACLSVQVGGRVYLEVLVREDSSKTPKITAIQLVTEIGPAVDRSGVDATLRSQKALAKRTQNHDDECRHEGGEALL